ncbi:glycosyltransferase family A protein [uncultured Draconibacterium sp.]|uniref:glycosyltransferase n=1 Tax=uncultured Draconibacterium sp. TaxID=1573823 RepID=UPI0032162731
MFADSYLNKNNNEPIIQSDAEPGTAIIVVIPCFREPEIKQTLESLKACRLPSCKVEVIVLINHSEIATPSVKEYNTATHAELTCWIENNEIEGLKFYAPAPIELKKKWAGAGLARKKGMDEAVRRFNTLDTPDGIVVSLDADTLVEQNYLVEIENYFQQNTKHVGATLAFEHQKEGLQPKQEEGILLYEKYLSYYKQSLDFTGYPYSLFTIGSAFAVRALAYVKRGGMNRRQAGEDFYFLQNLVQMGRVGEINTTSVYPSARLSDRVPFGTGPILQKWMNGEEDLTLSYNFQAFVDLKALFDVKNSLFKIDETAFENALQNLPASVAEFIRIDGFWPELENLNKNCSTLQTFQTRFYQTFNAFKILKYLNFAHETYFRKANLEEQLLLLNTAVLTQSNIK